MLMVKISFKLERDNWVEICVYQEVSVDQFIPDMFALAPSPDRESERERDSERKRGFPYFPFFAQHILLLSFVTLTSELI